MLSLPTSFALNYNIPAPHWMTMAPAPCPAPTDSFEHRQKLLSKLGIQTHRNYEYRTEGQSRVRVELDVFTTVLLPFSAEEWCGLCMSEGEHYIGGCCGNMSAVQDEINDLFREGGWADMGTLEDIATSMADHHGSDQEEYPFGELTGTLDELVDKAMAEAKDIGPWEKMAVAWQLVRGYHRMEEPRALRSDTPAVESACFVLSRGLRYIDMCRFFTKVSEETKFGEKGQDQAMDLVNLSRLLPALKTLNERIQELNPGPMEGFALIDKEKGPDEIASNRRGLCIFKKQEEADSLLQLWREQEEGRQESGVLKGTIDDRIGVRKVRVSADKGVEFLS